jgi:hypothetical protein
MADLMSFRSNLPPEANLPTDPDLSLGGESERPPILGSWRNLNLVVLCWLTFLILMMYGFTQYFS